MDTGSDESLKEIRSSQQLCPHGASHHAADCPGLELPLVLDQTTAGCARTADTLEQRVALQAFPGGDPNSDGVRTSIDVDGGLATVSISRLSSGDVSRPASPSVCSPDRRRFWRPVESQRAARMAGSGPQFAGNLIDVSF